MNKKKFIEDFIIAIVLSIIFLFVDLKISVGIIIGYGFSYLNYKLIEYRYKDLNKYTPGFMIGSIICILVLALPLLASFIYPKLLSWIGVMIGLMIIRTRLIIEAFIKK